LLCFVRTVDTRLIPSGDQVEFEHTLDVISGSEMSAGPAELWKRIIFGGTSKGGGSSSSGSGGAASPSISPSPVSFGGDLEHSAVSGTTTAQDVRNALDVPGDDRTWTVHVKARSEFAAHTCTPTIVQCSSAHVVESTVSTGTATSSTDGAWQTMPSFVAVSGKFYRLRVTMNSTAGNGAAIGIGAINA